MFYMVIPSTAAMPEDYKIAFGRGEFRGRFYCGSGGIVSSSELEEAYRSIACAEARPAPPPPVEVEDAFPPSILTFTEEVYSIILSLEDCNLNFLLCFRGLANAFSCSEVWSPEWDGPFTRFRFSVVFFGVGTCAAACRFLDMCAMGSRPS
jgi:hypothetical protein